MENTLFDSTLEQAKLSTIRLLQDIQELCYEINDTESFQIIGGLIININEPFSFVVVGEVKTGKSSFINALLGVDICKVANKPCTAKVEQIVYSEVEYRKDIQENLVKVGLPIEILKKIAIVDTPGTNTRDKNHQIITEQFIPKSDLVIFVFSSINPYTFTAGSLLELVSSEWRRNIIFILQKSDIATQDQLNDSTSEVRKYAIEQNISEPVIFTTSAKLEIEEQSELSGFIEIRSFIKDKVIEGEAQKLKLKSILNSADTIISRLYGNVSAFKEQLKQDDLLAQSVKRRLKRGKGRAMSEVNSLVETLASRYNQELLEIKKEFREGLSFGNIFHRSFIGIFDRSQSIKSWISNIQKKFHSNLNETLKGTAIKGAEKLLGSMKQLLSDLIEQLNYLQNSSLNMSDGRLVRIADRRHDTIEDVKKKIVDQLREESFVKSLDSDLNVAPGFLGGGAMAVLGTIIIVTETSVILSITGGILTGIGVMFAGGLLSFKRRNIIQEFEQKLNQSKQIFTDNLTEEFSSKLSVVYEEINECFSEFYEYVEEETQKITGYSDKLTHIKMLSDEIHRDIS